MSRHLVQESNVDLSLPPAKRPAIVDTGSLEITIGDLHANAMKLIFFLVTEGVLQVSSDVYKNLWNLYQTPSDQVTETTFKDFARILCDDVSVLRRDCLVRLIGDELSDRGANDFFVLLILEKLIDSQIAFEILFSNHGAEFLNRFYYLKKRFCYGQSLFHPVSFDLNLISLTPQLASLFTHSAQQLEKALDEGCVDIDELVKKVDNCYKPYIKLLSYSLDKQNNEITLFSHAPIDLEDIKALAFHFHVPYDDSTIEALGVTIDAINERAKPDLLYPYCDASVSASEPQSRSHPIYRCAWNRYIHDLNRPAVHPKGYKMHWVHGHDSQCVPSDPHVVNLDNELGKGPGYSKGEYTALVLNRNIPDPALQLAKMPTRSFSSGFFAQDGGSFRPFTFEELELELGKIPT